MKGKKKEDAKVMRVQKDRNMQIRIGQERVKENHVRIVAEKWQKVRQLKEDQIRAEIIKIGEKDSEARKLEKHEQKILKRLRETHEKQQEAIEEIQAIFQNTSSNRLRITDAPDLNSGLGSMPEQMYQPLQEEAVGLGESDDEDNIHDNIEAIKQGDTNINVASQVSNVCDPQ